MPPDSPPADQETLPLKALGAVNPADLSEALASLPDNFFTNNRPISPKIQAHSPTMDLGEALASLPDIFFAGNRPSSPFNWVPSPTNYATEAQASLPDISSTSDRPISPLLHVPLPVDLELKEALALLPDTFLTDNQCETTYAQAPSVAVSSGMDYRPFQTQPMEQPVDAESGGKAFQALSQTLPSPSSASDHAVFEQFDGFTPPPDENMEASSADSLQKALDSIHDFMSPQDATDTTLANARPSQSSPDKRGIPFNEGMAPESSPGVPSAEPLETSTVEWGTGSDPNSSRFSGKERLTSKNYTERAEGVPRGPPCAGFKAVMRNPVRAHGLIPGVHDKYDPTYFLFEGVDLQTIIGLDTEILENEGWLRVPEVRLPIEFVSPKALLIPPAADYHNT